jgi:alpha-glucosidase
MTNLLLNASTMTWWREAIIYQVYPRSYLDTNGDGVGDLPWHYRKARLHRRLGVDIVWLSPFFKSPMKDFGYDISDYCDVDPMFGTLADFDAMIAKAHSLGLKIMIDQVMAHTADAHPWFVESRSSRDNPKADWYVWSDPLAGRQPAEQLAVGVRRLGVAVGHAAASSTTCTTSWSASRSSTSTTRKCSRPTWTRCASGSSAASTACAWTPAFPLPRPQLRSNPPALVRDTSTVTDVNPYGMQAHIYDKTRRRTSPSCRSCARC